MGPNSIEFIQEFEEVKSVLKLHKFFVVLKDPDRHSGF